MTSTFTLKFLLVMLAMAAADWCWTKYMLYAASRDALKAAFWSSMIIACGAFTVTNYVEDPRLIVAALIGAFVGTYYAVEHGKETVDE